MVEERTSARANEVSLRVRESRKFGRKSFWVVDVLVKEHSLGYYIASDGSRSKEYVDYPSRLEALDAARLSGELCPDLRFQGEKADGGKKETNPKDIIGVRKVPLSTLSCPVLFEMGLGMLEGARKYGRHNYRAMGVSATVYYDAAQHHLMQWWEGEDIDPDSGLNHITKVMTALAVLRDSMLMGNWKDDRPLRNPVNRSSLDAKAAEIIDKYPDCVEPYLETNKGTRG